MDDDFSRGRKGFGFNGSIDSVGKTVMTNEVIIQIEVMYQNEKKEGVSVPQITRRDQRIGRVYGVPNRIILHLHPSSMPAQAYHALQRFCDVECMKEAMEVARRTEMNTKDLTSGNLALQVKWTPTIDMLSYNGTQIRKIDRRNKNDATMPMGDQVPHGAKLEAVAIMRQEISSRDQQSIVHVDALPYALPPPDPNSVACGPRSALKPLLKHANAIRTVQKLRRREQAMQEDGARSRRFATAELEKAALEAKGRSGGDGGLLGCCAARPAVKPISVA